jgi:hypothetical protein
MVAGSGGEADHRQVLSSSSLGDHRERAVAARDPERVRTVGHGVSDELRQGLVRVHNHSPYAALPSVLGDALPLGAPAAGPRVDEENRPVSRRDGVPAIASSVGDQSPQPLGYRHLQSP